MILHVLGASLGLVTKEVFEIHCCCWSLWMLYNSMLIALHWKTKHPVELEHIFQDSGIESVEDSHHFSVQIKYVHHYTSMTYKMKNTYRYEVALLVACRLLHLWYNQRSVIYYSIFYVHAQTFMLSRTWIGNNALSMNRCKIFYVIANLYTLQDLDLEQCILGEAV